MQINYDCGCVHIPSHQSNNGSWQPPEDILCDACEAKLEEEEQREEQNKIHRKETNILVAAFHVLEYWQKKMAESDWMPIPYDKLNDAQREERDETFKSVLQATSHLEYVIEHLGAE